MDKGRSYSGVMTKFPRLDGLQSSLTNSALLCMLQLCHNAMLSLFSHFVLNNRVVSGLVVLVNSTR